MNLPVDVYKPMNRVLVLGAGGHDGPFLCQSLLPKFEIIAHTRKPNKRLQDLNLRTVVGDLLDSEILSQIIFETKPDFVVNLVSLSSVFECQKNPELSHAINYKFVIELVQILERFGDEGGKKIRFLQSSSSEIFGSNEGPCDESTVLAPISQYGKDKALAHEYLQNYLTQGIEIKRAVLFNHESEYRNQAFVSQKIATAAARYRLGHSQQLQLGNVNSARDWGYAPDYMDALSLILEREGNETFVIASGELHTIEELIRVAFGVPQDFDTRSLFTTDAALFRKNETKPLVGSPIKILNTHGWKPKVGFTNMIEKMVQFQMRNMDPVT